MTKRDYDNQQWEQRVWEERLAQYLGIHHAEARRLMAMAEADLCAAGRDDCNYDDIYQLAADRGRQ